MEKKKFTDGRTDAEGYNIIRPFFNRGYNTNSNKFAKRSGKYLTEESTTTAILFCI